MKFYMSFIVFVVFIIQCSDVHSHELSPKIKRNIMQELINDRAGYDSCLKKAEKNINQEKAEKQCRKTYALKRRFTTKELYHLYMEHILVAEELYTNLLISVKGKVHKVSKSALGFPEVVFSLDAFGVTGVRCEFPNNMKKEVEKLQEGDEVTISGISKGLFNDDYVSLTHCEILK